MHTQVCAERTIRGVLNILCVTRIAPRRFIFTITKINTNPFPVVLQYNTTQRFDFAVISVATGREVWRWSFDRVFAPVIQRIPLRPGQSTSQSVEWPAVDNFGRPVPPGRYRVRGINLANIRRFRRDIIPRDIIPEEILQSGVIPEELLSGDLIPTDLFNNIADNFLEAESFTAMSQMPQLDGDFDLSEGKGVVAPNAKIISSSSMPGPGNSHTVRPGESLWKIAQQYGTTVDKLKGLNKINNPNSLKVGQKIKIR